MKTCCFSGYSSHNLAYKETNCEKLERSMKLVIEDLFHQGYSNYLCGFEEGADIYFAESLFEMQAKYSALTLNSIIPYENQAIDWPEWEREKYFNLLEKCNKETLLYTQYKIGCLAEKNKIMILNSDILIAVYDGKLSSTMQAIDYANKSVKKVICINPQSYNIQYLSSRHKDICISSTIQYHLK